MDDHRGVGWAGLILVIVITTIFVSQVFNAPGALRASWRFGYFVSVLGMTQVCGALMGLRGIRSGPGKLAFFGALASSLLAWAWLRE
jgi:hypothetical protein